jgi:hypothetical protein
MLNICTLTLFFHVQGSHVVETIAQLSFIFTVETSSILVTVGNSSIFLYGSKLLELKNAYFVNV